MLLFSWLFRWIIEILKFGPCICMINLLLTVSFAGALPMLFALRQSFLWRKSIHLIVVDEFEHMGIEGWIRARHMGTWLHEVVNERAPRFHSCQGWAYECWPNMKSPGGIWPRRGPSASRQHMPTQPRQPNHTRVPALATGERDGRKRGAALHLLDLHFRRSLLVPLPPSSTPKSKLPTLHQ